MIERLDIKRDAARNPLFDTVFVLQNMSLPDLKTKDLKFTQYQYERKITHFDFWIQAVQQAKAIDLSLEYCTRLFKKETMLRMAEHYVNILQRVAYKPDIRLSDIDISTEEELNRVLIDFSVVKGNSYDFDE